MNIPIWPFIVLALAIPVSLTAVNEGFDPTDERGPGTESLFADEADAESSRNLPAPYTGGPAPLLKRASAFLNLSDEEIVKRIPEQTPFITMECPSCGGRFATRGVHRKTNKDWTYDPAGSVTCQHCRATFPHKDYPENHTQTFYNTIGEAIAIRSHRNAEGKIHYVSGFLDSWRNEWLMENLQSVASLYRVTRDERYARTVILALDRYAQVFPHYLVKIFEQVNVIDAQGANARRHHYRYVSTGGPWMRDNRPGRGQRPSEPQASEQRTSVPYGWTESRWGWGRWNAEFPMELLAIYRDVKDSPTFEKLSAELKRDVRGNIHRHLFRNAFDHLATYPFWYHINNNASSHIAAIAHGGDILDDSVMLDFAVRWSREIIEKYRFSSDGHFAESPGYFRVFLASQAPSLDVLSAILAKRGLATDLATSAKAIAFLKKTDEHIESLRFPNGGGLPIGDDRHDGYLDPLFRVGGRSTVRPESTDLLRAAYGHALLGDGAGDRQVQAHLHFASFTDVGHAHCDNLSIMLWAFGAELFTDIGYHKTKYRAYGGSTLSHNTVVVDRETQAGADTKGNVLWHDASVPGLSLVKVESNGSYAGKTSRYRRTLLLNTRDLAHPYLVDIFEVRGGSVQDYVLHGPTLFDSKATASLPLEPMPAERPMLAAGEQWDAKVASPFYGVFTAVSTARVSDGFAITFTLENPYVMPEYKRSKRYDIPRETLLHITDLAHFPGKKDIGVRSHFVMTGQPARLHLARSPSLVRAGMHGGPLLEKLTRPSVVLRREREDGSGELTTTYIAVHEPFYDTPLIRSVHRELSTTVPESSVVLAIETPEGTDRIAIAVEDNAVIRTDSLALEGRFAFVAERASGATAASIGAAKLEAPGIALENPAPAHTGAVVEIASTWDGAPRNALRLDTSLPPGEVLKGTTLVVRFGESDITLAYTIDHIDTRDGATWAVLTDEPGLRPAAGHVREIFFPRRTLPTPMYFTVLTSKRSP